MIIYIEMRKRRLIHYWRISIVITTNFTEFASQFEIIVVQNEKINNEGSSWVIRVMQVDIESKIIHLHIDRYLLTFVIE